MTESIRSRHITQVETFASGLMKSSIYITFTRSNGTSRTFTRTATSPRTNRLASVLNRAQRAHRATIEAWYHSVGWTATLHAPPDALCATCLYQVRIVDEATNSLVGFGCTAFLDSGNDVLLITSKVEGWDVDCQSWEPADESN